MNPVQRRVRLAWDLMLFGAGIWAAFAARHWDFETRVFPTITALAMAGLAMADIGSLLKSRGARAGAEPEDGPEETLLTSASTEPPSNADDIHPLQISEHPLETSVAADAETSDEFDPARLHDILVVVISMTALCVFIWVAGFRVGSLVWTVVFARFVGKESFKVAIALGIGIYLFLLLSFDISIGLPLPGGVLAQLMGITSLDWFVVETLRQML